MDTREFTIAAATVVVAIAAIGAFGYYLGRDTVTSEIKQLEREIQLYQSSQDMKNVLDFLDDLKTYNENLFEFSHFTGKINELQEQIDADTAENTRLSGQLGSVADELKAANEEIANLNSVAEELHERLNRTYTIDEEFEIAEGRTRKFLRKELVIGVQDLYSSRAVITIFGDTDFLDVGEGVEFSTEGAQCHLIYDGRRKSTEGYFGKFTLLCQ